MRVCDDRGELLQGRILQRPVDNFSHLESSPRMLPKRYGEDLQGQVLSEGWIALNVFLKRKIGQNIVQGRGCGLCYGPVVR